MIPQFINELFVKSFGPDWRQTLRIIAEGEKRWVEFHHTDPVLLSKIGITVDNLGPHLVSIMWIEDGAQEIGGYLCVDNLAMGQPSMGGIRLTYKLTPDWIFNLARGMTLKNAAALLPFGGGKSGIVRPVDGPLSEEVHSLIVHKFATLIARYKDIYVPGPDVGTSDKDMGICANLNGIDASVSKPIQYGGNRIDELGGAGVGCIVALRALLREMPRLAALPQFRDLRVPPTDELTISIQGFGAVGAHAARATKHMLPGSRVVGISDEFGYLYDTTGRGLDVDYLFELWHSKKRVTPTFFEERIKPQPRSGLVYSTNPNGLLREDAWALIPATPMWNYIGEAESNPCVTPDRMGHFSVSVEGANTYSPLADRKALRRRMETELFFNRHCLIATDFLVNSGGVIFAAQELHVPTPPALAIPQPALGKASDVQSWLASHAAEFSALAERRRAAGEKWREDAIATNMKELVDLLVAKPTLLPCQAAERISVQRLTRNERARSASAIMQPLPTVPAHATMKAACEAMIAHSSPLVAVLGDTGLAGVVTEWDIASAVAKAQCGETLVSRIMTAPVIAVPPTASLLDCCTLLEAHKISNLPVVDGGKVLGLVTSDSLAVRSLMHMLNSKH